MFGHHQAKREKKRLTRQNEALQAEVDRFKDNDKNGFQEHQQQILSQEEAQKERDRIARLEGQKIQEEFMGRDWKGLDPVHRASLQESANAQIAKDVGSYEKRLLAQQGHRGVRGGSAYAQKRDLARLGTEAQQQTGRELTNLDANTRLNNMAAAYNVEQGEVAQGGIRHQMAQHDVESYDQKKYQKWLAEQA